MKVRCPKSIFKGPALIAYLVKQLNERAYPQVGKTVVQKLAYLLSREGIGNFVYSMYHYGPYSAQVSGELEFAKDLDAVEIKWVPEQGFHITPKETDALNQFLSEEDKAKIDKIVDKYSCYSAIELSIITTALFVKDNFEVKDDEELIHVASSLKPSHNKDWIQTTLKKANVIK